jgi:hypothetical protein
MKQRNNAKKMANRCAHFLFGLHGSLIIYLKAKRIANLSEKNIGKEKLLLGDPRTRSSSTKLVQEIEWLKLLDRVVFLVDGSTLGKIEAINSHHVVVKKGSIKATRYYLRPEMLKKKKFKGYDYKYQAGLLELDLTPDEARLYESTRIPNPSRYVTLGTTSSSCFGYFPVRYGEGREKEHG